MADLVVIKAASKFGEEGRKSYRIRLLLSFFAIYILWGTTFLAIRIAVEEPPHLFAAGARFFTPSPLLPALM